MQSYGLGTMGKTRNLYKVMEAKKCAHKMNEHHLSGNDVALNNAVDFGS